MADRIHYRSTRGAPVTQHRLDDADAQHARIVGDINKAFNTVDDTFAKWGNWTVVTCTKASTAKAFDIVLADPTGAGFTLTIPDPTTCENAWIQIKNDSASVNTITVQTSAPPNTGQIDGANTFALTGARARMRIASLNGPNDTKPTWKVM